MDIFLATVGLAFSVWMCFDCIQRKEHFIWIVLMIALVPFGAIAYYFLVKSKSKKQINLFKPSAAKVVESEETLQLKDLIGKFHKAYHYEKLGQVYLDQKNYELAIAQFEEAIIKDSEMNEARYGLAKGLHGMGRYTEGAVVLEELVKLDKKYDYGNAIFGLAECYRLAGEEEKALKAYGDVIDAFHFFKAYYHYARLLDNKGDKEEAINYMKNIIGSSKNLPDYKLEKERYWIDEAYKYLRKNGVELA
jgi:tetratricopeptide (TPR) repeat protein